MSRLRVARSTSTKTTLAPVLVMTLAVAKKLCDGVITSSPGPTPSISSASCMAPVAEVIVRTGRPPTYWDNAFSNASTCGPLAIQRLRSVSATAATMSSSIEGRAKGRYGDGPRFSGSRDKVDPDDDEPDAHELLHGERLAEEPVGSERVDDVAQRKHGVGHAHRHARQAQDPHDHAEHVAGETGQDRRVQQQLRADRHDVGGGE